MLEINSFIKNIASDNDSTPENALNDNTNRLQIFDSSSLSPSPVNISSLLGNSSNLNNAPSINLPPINVGNINLNNSNFGNMGISTGISSGLKLPGIANFNFE
jgi:hypothetical protein